MSSFLFLISLILMSHYASSQELQDDRCLLQTGGSTLRFLVAEDLEIGGVVGIINVQGTVNEDIIVSLSDSDQSNSILQVEVRNGSAVLVLAGQLDREGVSGPSKVVTSVQCARLGDKSGDSDLGFEIPVRVRVTDVNDNAPQFLGAPYNVNLSEVTQIGTKVLRVEAVDSDQRGPFSTVEYQLEYEKNQDHYFEVDSDGRVTLLKSLDYEDVAHIKVKLIAKDQGSPAQVSQTFINLNVLDADDQNPAFDQNRYEAVVDEWTPGAILDVLPKSIYAYDQDLNINSSIVYSLSGMGSLYNMFSINSVTGEVFINNQSTEEELRQELRQPGTLIVQATQKDNIDRYSITTLTLRTRETTETHVSSRVQANLSFNSEHYHGQVVENMPVGSVVINLDTTGITDLNDIKYQVASQELPDGEFTVSQNGDVLVMKELDFETRQNYSFHVMVTNGRHRDLCLVNISVINVNDWDPRFKYPEYEFYVNAANTDVGHIVGVVEVFDGDVGDVVSLDLIGHSARVFGITEVGEIYIRDLSFLMGTEAHIVVTARDSGSPPRQASVPVIIRFDAELKPDSSPRELVIDGQNMLLIIIMCSVSSVFILIIISLCLIICKTKRRFKSTSPTLSGSDTDSMYLQQNSGQFPSQVGSVNLSYKLAPSSMTTTTNNGRPSSAVSEKSEATMASMMSSLQQPTSLISSNSLITFGGKQVKHKSNKVTPQDLDSSAINDCGLPTNSSPVPEKSEQTYQKKNYSKSSSQNIYANQQIIKDSDQLQQELKTNILQHSNSAIHRNDPSKRVEWPRGSIPRSVKKLSWDDETLEHDKIKNTKNDLRFGKTGVVSSGSRPVTVDKDREVPVLMDVNVSLTPLSPITRQGLNGDPVFLET